MNSKRMKKKLAFLIVMFILFVSMAKNLEIVHASSEGSTDFGKRFQARVNEVTVKAGEKIHISIPIELLGVYECSTAQSLNFTVDTTSNKSLSVTSDVSLYKNGTDKEIDWMDRGEHYTIEFDLEADEAAKNGKYSLPIVIDGTYLSVWNGMTTFSYTLPRTLLVKVTDEKLPADIRLSNLSYKEEVELGEEFTINVKATNIGELKAKGVKVTLGDFSDSSDIIPNYATTDMELGDMKGGASKGVLFPLKIGKDAKLGNKSIKITASWYKSTTADNGAVTWEMQTVVMNLFVQIVAPEGGRTLSPKPNLIVSGVNQVPAQPKAGHMAQVSFVIENRSASDMMQVKLTPTNIMESGLQPVSSNPYIYIDKIAANSVKTVQTKLTLSKEITEGIHTLSYDVKYQYIDSKVGGYMDGTDSIHMFIKDVVNPSGSMNTSVPKLIVSKFDIGKDPLKAGAVFPFTFEVKNTHNSVAAKNIKVTLSSENNIFSQTSGSNSFYISEIPANGAVSKTIELKIKGDAASNAYPLKVSFDYEYSGKAAAGEDDKKQGNEAAGNTMEEVLNIQVDENARPVVQDIYLSSYEEIRVNEVSTLMFNFYNMGKSTLNNVTATVVSDNYQAADTSTLFIGNVEAGAGNTYEINVIPLIEGDCPGQLKVSYEDSNGNVIDTITDFTQMVSPAESMEPAMPMGSSAEAMAPVVEPKKAIVSTWLFVIIQIVVFLVSIFVSRKIKIACYKRKLRRLEEE